MEIKDGTGLYLMVAENGDTCQMGNVRSLKHKL